MFRSPIFRSGTIISDEGFRLRLTLPYVLRYWEDDLVVDVSCDAVKPHIDLLHSSVSAFKNGSFTRLTAAEDKQLFDNISRALEWRGYNVTVVS